MDHHTMTDGLCFGKLKMNPVRKRNRCTYGMDSGPVVNPSTPAISDGQRKRQRRSPKSLTKTSYEDLLEYYNYIVDVEDILEDHNQTQKSKDQKPLVLNMDTGDWDYIPEYNHLGVLYKPKMCVRLRNGTFLKISHIIMEFDHNYVVFRGHKMALTARLGPFLDEVCNQGEAELFLDLEVENGSEAAPELRALVDVPVTQVEDIVTIHYSNCLSSYRFQPDIYYCRWKLTRFYKNTKDGRKSAQTALQRLTSLEADDGHRIPDEVVREAWRGPTEAGGSDSGQYTAADLFCGAGGWSRGATMAGGFKVIRSVDTDSRACSTYRINFPSTNCFNEDVFDYSVPGRLSGQTEYLASNPKFLDVAHYSTPCQTFSPAHTREGVNDEKNFAASLSLMQLIMKDKPRFITFENTDGLARRHFEDLKPIFGQLTALNYSIRFASLSLADYGLPQSRGRLIMIASGPGEILPTFPPITHSENGEIPGTLPWTNPLEAISDIPFEGWQNHRPRDMKKSSPSPRARELARTVTTSGQGLGHPDGRQYTVCELQLIQGFPLNHRFAPNLSRSQMIRQIGNAFPPMFVKILLRHIRKQIQRSDGVPETIDKDEFMTQKESREQEIAQFFKDHEQLPAGTRANLFVADDDNDNDSEEDINEEQTDLYNAKETKDENALADEDLAIDDELWSWITAGSTSRRHSNHSQGSSTASSSQSSGRATVIGTARPCSNQGNSVEDPIEL